MYLQRTFKRVGLPGQLASTTIVVLGLREMGYRDPKMIARLLHRRGTKDVHRLLRMLKTSRNPVVRQCVDEGLPRGLSRRFPYKGAVRCPTCHEMVDHAPCPKCYRGNGSVMLDQDAYESLPLDTAPTEAEPGSWSKVEVMTRRAAEGLSVFHPEDAR